MSDTHFFPTLPCAGGAGVFLTALVVLVGGLPTRDLAVLLVRFAVDTCLVPLPAALAAVFTVAGAAGGCLMFLLVVLGGAPMASPNSRSAPTHSQRHG